MAWRCYLRLILNFIPNFGVAKKRNWIGQLLIEEIPCDLIYLARYLHLRFCIASNAAIHDNILVNVYILSLYACAGQLNDDNLR